MLQKWSVKWRNWNISDIFFSLSSIEGQKQQRQPETFALCMGTIPSERARQENDSLVLRRIVLALVALHIQDDPRQCAQELANMMNCDHSIIVRHLHSMGKGTACSKQNTKIGGWPYVHLCLLVIDWLMSNIDHFYPEYFST